ncbi:MAG: glycosyltransferase family 87 protein [Pseudolysinimonas sp.]
MSTTRLNVARLVGASLAVAAMAGATGVMVGTFGYLEKSKRPEFVFSLVALWVLFAVACLLLRRASARAAIVVILLGSIALGGAAMSGPPDTSSDSARYAWDGIVQDAGISPYAHAPSDPALASLRPEWLFPTPVVDADGATHCPGIRNFGFTENDGSTACTTINRVHVPTIYPPTSELFYAAVRGVVPVDAAYWPFQLTGLLLSAGTTVLLLVGLRRRGWDPRWAALWALNPLVASEAITNSHIDVLGALLALAAAFAVASGARWRGGILLGAAIAAKIIPVLAAPALLRRQPAKIVLAAVATFAVLYVPYVATTGVAVLGYLPGYLNEEGYDDGSRFVLLTTLLPGPIALVVAGGMLAAIAVLVIVFSDPERPWVGQVVMIGATLIIASPRYPWYALLLLPFIAMSGRWEWLTVPFVLALHVVEPQNATFRWSLLAAIAVIAAVSILRARPAAVQHPKPAATALRTLSVTRSDT